jgi:hypothetical protein
LIAGDGVVDILIELSMHSVMEEGPKVDRGVNVEELVNKYGLLREELVPKEDLVKLGNDEYVENIYDEVVKEIDVKSCSPIPSSDTVLLGVTNENNFVLLNKKYEILYKLKAYNIRN